MAEATLGRLITAMVTPFDDNGDVDIARARELAARLVDEQDNDAVLVSGTTGESPTTTPKEKLQLAKAVKEEVGDRAKVIAGIGSNDTRASVELARETAKLGVDGLLAVTPFYSLPPQDAIVSHFKQIADATDLPVILYDIPHRAGREIATESMIELAEHPNIYGVKDAKKDVAGAARVIAETDLVYYAGDDAMVLSELSIGGQGLVGTSTHFTGRRTKELINAWFSGDQAKALSIYQELLPVYTGVFATQGVMMVKAGLAHQGFSVGGLRAPLLDAPAELAEEFGKLLDETNL